MLVGILDFIKVFMWLVFRLILATTTNMVLSRKSINLLSQIFWVTEKYSFGSAPNHDIV